MVESAFFLHAHFPIQLGRLFINMFYNPSWLTLILLRWTIDFHQAQRYIARLLIKCAVLNLAFLAVHSGFQFYHLIIVFEPNSFEMQINDMLNVN